MSLKPHKTQYSKITQDSQIPQYSHKNHENQSTPLSLTPKEHNSIRRSTKIIRTQKNIYTNKRRRPRAKLQYEGNPKTTQVQLSGNINQSKRTEPSVKRREE